MLSTFEKQTVIKFVVENHVLASSTSALGKKVGITGNSSFLRVCSEDAGVAAINNIFDRICNAYDIKGEELQTFVNCFELGQQLAQKYTKDEDLSTLLYDRVLEDLKKGGDEYNLVLATWFLTLRRQEYCTNNSFTVRDIKKAIWDYHKLLLKAMPEKSHLASTAVESFLKSSEMFLSDKQRLNWDRTLRGISEFVKVYTNDSVVSDYLKLSILPDFLSGFTVWVNADDFSQSVGRILMLKMVRPSGLNTGPDNGWLYGWIFDSVDRDLPSDQKVSPKCLQMVFFEKDEKTYFGSQVEIQSAEFKMKLLALTGSQESITLEFFDRTPLSIWRRINTNDQDSKWGSFLKEFRKNYEDDILYEILGRNCGLELIENKRVINVSMETKGIRLDVYDEVADEVTLYRLKTDKILPFRASDAVYMITQGEQTFFMWLNSRDNLHEQDYSLDISRFKQTTMSWAEYENSPFSPYYD